MYETGKAMEMIRIPFFDEKNKMYFIQKFTTNFDKIFNLFFIEKKQILEYNKNNKIPGMYDTLLF